MGDVVNFNGEVTFNDIDPKEMIKNAMEEFSFDHAILIGWNESSEFTVCSSTSKSAEIVYSLEVAKQNIMLASTE